MPSRIQGWDGINTANLDSFRYEQPHVPVIESGPVAFLRWMDNTHCRPHRTEAQLCKALAALKRNIIREAITDKQREAVARLRCVIRNLEFHFYMTFGMDIDDMQTVYADCVFGLVSREDEPSVYLMGDWILLPSV